RVAIDIADRRTAVHRISISADVAWIIEPGVRRLTLREAADEISLVVVLSGLSEGGERICAQGRVMSEAISGVPELQREALRCLGVSSRARGSPSRQALIHDTNAVERQRARRVVVVGRIVEVSPEIARDVGNPVVPRE